MLLVALAALVATTPSTSSAEGSLPVSIELGPTAPLSARRISIEFDVGRDPDINGGEVRLTFEDLPADVRVTIVDEARELVGWSSVAPGSRDGRLLSISEQCGDDSCQRVVLVIFELTGHDPVDIEATGEVTWQLHGDADAVLDPAALSIDVREEPPPQRSITSDVARGDLVTLDADHPAAVQRVEVHLDPGEVADDTVAVQANGSLRFESVGRDEEPPIWVRVEEVDGRGDGASSPGYGAGPSEFMIPPARDCGVGSACDATYEISIWWRGDPGTTSEISWEFEGRITQFGPGAASTAAASVESIGSTAVASALTGLSQTTSGEIVVGTDGELARAESEMLITISAAAVRHAAGASPMVPAFGILTYEAEERNGPREGGDWVRLISKHGHTALAAHDFPADGAIHELVILPFRSCHTAGPCRIEHRLEAFIPTRPSSIELPATIRWSLEVRLASFDLAPFPADATIEFGPVDGQ